MTALKQYSRLECDGIWRPGQDAQRREVIVSFGNASLVISDTANRALDHWSLAAVARMNPGEEPALYTPSAEASETLEIEDSTMIEAIEKVRAGLDRARPRQGRVRWLVTAGIAAAVIGLGVFWLPEALLQQAVGALPPSARADIGTELFRAIGRVSGAPCRTPRGDRALAQLHNRLVAPREGAILVLRDGLTGTVTLPGGLILLDRRLVEDHETPDVAAGYILAEVVRTEAESPMERLLRASGPFATLKLLTSGEISDKTLNAYAEYLVGTERPQVAPTALLPKFQAARVSSTPYAYAEDISGEATLPLIESDPMRGGDAEPVLTDSSWVALQNICGT
ncbi:hypothetical protein [Tropicimonas sp. IMCC34011]|uniref:hypothetical protein n=1 Tax=Tropicimonas sp. IMCC34011 TaxID=2248759 RepID=UPI000E22E00A|nr:hypothetical protein [Tropicimonas sp. IMCC34011]